MSKSLGGISGSHEPGLASRPGPPGFDPGRSPTLIALECSTREAIIDDVTQVIQRTPYICRYPKRLFDIGLVHEFADALDRLNVKLAELQGEDR
jgi:hypothetical protein